MLHPTRLIMDIFHRLHEEQGKTIVLITHSPELSQETERIITLRDGDIKGEADGRWAEIKEELSC